MNSLLVFVSLCDRSASNPNIVVIKKARAACPEGYEEPGCTKALGKLKPKSYRKSEIGGPGCLTNVLPYNSNTCVAPKRQNVITPLINFRRTITMIRSTTLLTSKLPSKLNHEND